MSWRAPRGVWLRAAARGGEEFVFASPADQELNAAIKRLPGRRFDFTDRTWVVPAVPSLAGAVQELLEEHPWLTVSDDVEDWLDAHAHGWGTLGTVVEHEGGPYFVVETLYGAVPRDLLDGAAERDRGALLLRADAVAADLLDSHASIDFDGPAAAVWRRWQTARLPPAPRWT